MSEIIVWNKFFRQKIANRKFNSRSISISLKLFHCMSLSTPTSWKQMSNRYRDRPWILANSSCWAPGRVEIIFYRSCVIHSHLTQFVGLSLESFILLSPYLARTTSCSLSTQISEFICCKCLIRPYFHGDILLYSCTYT